MIWDWVGDHKTLFGWMLVLSIVMFVGSLILVPWVIVRLPKDYFARRKRHHTPWADQHPVVRTLLLIVKNLLGIVFLAVGVSMLVLPGQGLLTIAVGVLLLDFPGKYRLERWVIGRSPVLRSINWLRRRAHREPLVVDE
jgi:hypothetical protein